MSPKDKLDEIKKLNYVATMDMKHWGDDQILMNWINQMQPEVTWLIAELERAWERESKLVEALELMASGNYFSMADDGAAEAIELSEKALDEYENAFANHAKEVE